MLPKSAVSYPIKRREKKPSQQKLTQDCRLRDFVQIMPANPASVGAFFYLANFGSSCFAQTGTSIVLRSFPAADRGKVLAENRIRLRLCILVVCVTPYRPYFPCRHTR